MNHDTKHVGGGYNNQFVFRVAELLGTHKTSGFIDLSLDEIFERLQMCSS